MKHSNTIINVVTIIIAISPPRQDRRKYAVCRKALLGSLNDSPEEGFVFLFGPRMPPFPGLTWGSGFAGTTQGSVRGWQDVSLCVLLLLLLLVKLLVMRMRMRMLCVAVLLLVLMMLYGLRAVAVLLRFVHEAIVFREGCNSVGNHKEVLVQGGRLAAIRRLQEVQDVAQQGLVGGVGPGDCWVVVGGEGIPEHTGTLGGAGGLGGAQGVEHGTQHGEEAVGDGVERGTVLHGRDALGHELEALDEGRLEHWPAAAAGDVETDDEAGGVG